MAGAGRKTFTAGSVLTASDVMNYLQDQAVMVFGGTAARSSAIPSPSEGMVSFRTDDNAVEYYDGTNWTSALNPTVNNQTGTTYTFVATDNGKLVTANNSSSQTFTVPPQSSVAWPAGTILSVVSYGTGTVTFAGGVGVTVTNTANTLSQYQGASLVRTGSDAWTVIPLSGGANALSDANVTGTTGSPTTATYTSGGINYKTYAFTGSGTFVTNREGLVDVLLIAGGGAGGATWGGGGGGSAVEQKTIVLPSGTATITVGGGGSATTYQGNNGSPSAISLGSTTYYASTFGGGGGASSATGATTTGRAGSSGGGGSGGGYAGTGGSAWLSGLGNAGGGSSVDNQGGGGGGAGAVGGTGGTKNGGNGGNGISNSLRTGSAVTYGGGGGGSGQFTLGTGGTGGGGTGAAGTANTGGGGGSGVVGAPGSGFAGGSGLVVIRVRA